MKVFEVHMQRDHHVESASIEVQTLPSVVRNSKLILNAIITTAVRKIRRTLIHITPAMIGSYL